MLMPVKIRVVDPKDIKTATFRRGFADAVILTRDNKILLQQRPSDWRRHHGCLVAFGGGIESGETPLQALVRELKEELCADVGVAEVVEIAALTEEFTNYSEIIHGYFWHDKEGSIQDCLEGDAVSYGCVADALAHPKIMDYLVWLLEACKTRGLLT